MESLTNSIAHHARKLIDEIEGHGGMVKAIEKGIPKLKIEECSARKQARIDRGEDVIVGVNKYRIDEEEELETLEVDNTEVRKKQIARLEYIKARRDQKKVDNILSRLESCAQAKMDDSGGADNLLALCIEAMEARCTVGEVSEAIAKVCGRYEASNKLISGVYASSYEESDDFESMVKLSEEFAKRHGRRPRIYVAKMGQDGHDRGAKIIATAFADLGFDVDVGPLFQTPEEVAQSAIDNDVHCIGVSSLAGGHKTLVPRLIDALKSQDAEDIPVFCGGVIPQKDYQGLKAKGVAAIFGPGSNILNSAREVLKIIEEKL